MAIVSGREGINATGKKKLATPLAMYARCVSRMKRITETKQKFSPAGRSRNGGGT